MKKSFKTISTIVLIIIETALYTLGFYQMVNYLTAEQATAETSRFWGTMYFIFAIIIFFAVDWLYFYVAERIHCRIERRRRNNEVTILRDPGNMCPLGGSVSRERCDYCTFGRGTFGGSIKCSKI